MAVVITQHSGDEDEGDLSSLHNMDSEVGFQKDYIHGRASSEPSSYQVSVSAKDGDWYEGDSHNSRDLPRNHVLSNLNLRSLYLKDDAFMVEFDVLDKEVPSGSRVAEP